MMEAGMDHQSPAKVKVRVGMTATKIHGPNSTLASPGTREEIEMAEPTKVIELDYEQACEMLGSQVADELFGRSEGT
jgi:hypothetical protein